MFISLNDYKTNPNIFRIYCCTCIYDIRYVLTYYFISHYNMVRIYWVRITVMYGFYFALMCGTKIFPLLYLNLVMIFKLTSRLINSRIFSVQYGNSNFLSWVQINTILILSMKCGKAIWKRLEEYPINKYSRNMQTLHNWYNQLK